MIVLKAGLGVERKARRVWDSWVVAGREEAAPSFQASSV